MAFLQTQNVQPRPACSDKEPAPRCICSHIKAVLDPPVNLLLSADQPADLDVEETNSQGQ
jgi:hypothetical protein